MRDELLNSSEDGSDGDESASIPSSESEDDMNQELLDDDPDDELYQKLRKKQGETEQKHPNGDKSAQGASHGSKEIEPFIDLQTRQSEMRQTLVTQRSDSQDGHTEHPKRIDEMINKQFIKTDRRKLDKKTGDKQILKEQLEASRQQIQAHITSKMELEKKCRGLEERAQ